MDISRIKDIETLRTVAMSYELQFKKQEERIARLEIQLKNLKPSDQLALQLEIDALKQQLALRNKIIFGTSSEKRPDEKSKSDEEKEAKPQTGHGPTPQLELESIEKEHALDEADMKCKSCGEKLQEWKDQAIESEEIDVVERRYILVRHKRKKYRCACGGCVEVALGPRKLIPGGRYSIDFAVQVAVDKYCDHLPLERQCRIMNRLDLDVSSQALWDQILALSNILKSAHLRLLDYIRSSSVAGADETFWRILNKKSKRWHVWALSAEDAVAYIIEDNRATKSARKLIGDFQGTLIVDAYSAYSALEKETSGLRLAHCWAHVRRKYVEIESIYPQECKEILDLIGELYEVEREAGDGADRVELRRKLRNEKSREIIDKIHSWAVQIKELRESSLRKAIEYMGGCWKGLIVFLDDPNVAVDNNATERALRGLVVGRKNHYGSKSRRGTEVAAILYSMIESAKLVGLNPKKYLKMAVNAHLDGVEIPLPHEVAAQL
jgi:transposase